MPGRLAIEDFGAELLQVEGVENPYPVYDRMREHGGVVWSDVMGAWLTVTHTATRDVYRSFEQFSSATRHARLARLPRDLREQIPTVMAVESAAVLNVADPPVHTWHRRLVNRPLTPRSLASRRAWIDDLCASLVESMAAEPEPDVLEHFATPLAFSVILGLFGSPLEHIPIYQDTADAYFAFSSFGSQTPENALRYERSLIALRQALDVVYASMADTDPSETIIGALLDSGQSDPRLDPIDLFALLRKFFAAGHENLIHTIAVAVLELLRHPDQLARVRAEPWLAAAAYEEAARWEAPNQANGRVVVDDMSAWGQRLRAGDQILAVKGAANRDPSVWTDAGRFDISRDQNEPPGGSVAFGQGIHFCVGAGLARLAGPAGVRAIVERFPRLRLLEDWSPGWEPSPLRRKLTALPVRID